MADERRLRPVRIRIPLAPGSDRAWIRLEWEDEDFLVSPLLGPDWLCEQCWVTRRVATRDPATLAPRATCGDDLIAAFDDWVSASGRPSGRAQRASVAKLVRGRVRVARGRAPPDSPPTLLRVTPSGGVVTEPVLPRPDCAICWARPTLAPRPALDHAIGRAAGIVVELVEVPPRPAEPEYPHVVTTRLSNARLAPARPVWRGASGKGDSSVDAQSSAVGESIERYAAETVPLANLVRARVDELDETIHPCRLTGMDAQQARAAGFDPDRETTWVQARSLREPGCQWWVPASAVYLASSTDLGGPAATPATSNGLAAATKLDDAIRRAYEEVLERHVFFRVWYGVAEAEVPDASSYLDEELRDRFRMFGLVLGATVLGRLDGVYIASASCWPDRSSPSRPGFTLGLGNGPTAEQAVRSATREVAQIYRGLTWALNSSSMRERMRLLHEVPQAVAEPYDHALLYATREVERVPAPFGRGPRRPGSVRAVDDLGDRALFVDLTPRDVAHACGVRVARVVVPDAVPLHVGCRTVPRRALDLAGVDDAEMADLLHPLS